MKKRTLLRTILLSAGTLTPLLATPLVAAACQAQPELLLSNSAKATYKSKGYNIAGSANDWNRQNFQIQNPISPKDPLYLVQKYAVNEKGEPIYVTNAEGKIIYYKYREENGKKIILRNDRGYPIEAQSAADGIPIQKTIANDEAPEDHVYQIIDMFKVFEIKSLSPKYDYRIFTFTWDQLTENFPATANDSRYRPYKNNKKALFAILYWNLKMNEMSVNWESDFVLPSIRALERIRPDVSIPTAPLELVPWPYFKNIIGKDQFWKNATEPVVLLFENE
ncbi:variable surface lipoprotein [Metamycoplasma neophronis]|uniref:Uncharacterized protein n=1 Tax=Metamycoplasma neophronis TaxID=872983 RepID=A0ABY2YZT4_9BACT|nr:variable surface lipoprotein [Metamycoplasma neophronis]TPR53880.1 hypothetical protein FJR74_01810 [Metamycoplasma neophronis]